MVKHEIPATVSNGLTASQVAQQREKYGYNELSRPRKKSFFKQLLEVLSEPMFLLLLGSSIIYLFIGDTSEAIMLGAFVNVVIIITFVQERKAEHSIEALRDLSSPRALVMRDGEQVRIPARDLVPEDIIVLTEGDRVPADAVLLSCRDMSVNESLLTGEAVPVRKRAAVGEKQVPQPGGENQPFVYASTVVTTGYGLARVVTTGTRTFVGKIGVSLTHIETEETLLQKDIRGLVKQIAIFGFIICFVAFLIFGLRTGDWLHALLTGLSLVMSLLPEEFSVVLVIFLALGVFKMAKKHVLTRRMPVIETLGSATVLCVDKTGTLTENRMRVAVIANQHKAIPADGQEFISSNMAKDILHMAILASDAHTSDPIDKAVVTADHAAHPDLEVLRREYVHIETSSMPQVSMVRMQAYTHGKTRVVAAKGAPEAMFDLCKMPGGERKELQAMVEKQACTGLRLLGVAVAKHIPASASLSDADSYGFEFLGLIGFEDPVRESVPEAVSVCHTAGIRVVIVTGDYPVTAQHVAKSIGLTRTDTVITGPQISSWTNAELKHKVMGTDVFARILPEQKLLLVEAFKANGQVVAMTGDGVNDAPALKSAHIGIAMGERGTDVAREAASLVLLNDNFLSIVSAIKMGRRIYDNIRKAVAYILAIHVPIAGITLLGVVTGQPLVLLPVHIALLELIIDPACSIVFEAEPSEANIMKRSPRKVGVSMFTKSAIMLNMMQGVGGFVIISMLYFYLIYSGMPETMIRGISFIALISVNIGLIVSDLSWSSESILKIMVRNRALQLLVLGTAIVLMVIFNVPLFEDMFKVSSIPFGWIVVAVLTGVVGYFVSETIEYIERKLSLI